MKLAQNTLKHLMIAIQEVQVKIIKLPFKKKKKEQMTRTFRESITSNIDKGRLKLVLLYQLEEGKLGKTRGNLSIWIKKL